MQRKYRSLDWVGLACVCWLGACSDSASVGKQPCIGATTSCTLPQPKELSIPMGGVAVSTRGLTDVLPEWVKPMPAGASDDGVAAPFWILGTTDGTAWQLSTDIGGLRYSVLNDDGSLGEGDVIGPPSELNVPYPSSVFINGHRGGQRLSPTIQVIWNAVLDPKADQNKSYAGWEWIFFGDSLAERTRRQIIQEDESSELLADDGRQFWFLNRTDAGPIVERQDLSGHVLWRQAALQTRDYANATFDAAAVGDGTLALTVNSSFQSASDLTPEWFKLDANGNIVEHRRTRIIFTPLGGPPHELSDTQGRQLALATNFDQSLSLLRVAPDGSTGEVTTILRDDYLELGWEAVTMSADGTLYAATEIGGREPADRAIAVCRMPEDSPLVCFRIPRAPLVANPSSDPYSASRPSEIVVAADESLFIHVGNQLLRIKLPS
jgi:hypothetical protein